MDVSDWRSVSTHYIKEKIVEAIESQNIATAYKPTLLIAAGEDALSVARIVRSELKARGVASAILTSKLEVLDEDTNPYNYHLKPFTESFSGQRILVVDKADNSRTSIAKFIQDLQAKVAAQGVTDASIGVFVLHNKRRPKAADLPDDIIKGRYFVGEETDNVQIAYPFNLSEVPNAQPVAHGEHASGSVPPLRRSLEQVPSRGRSPQPVLSNGASDIRSVSSHYIETIIEKAVEEQQMVEKFQPTVVVAASDGALPPARFLRQYLRFRAATHVGSGTGTGGVPPEAAHPDIPVLTPKLEIYDEDLNPYLAHLHGTTPSGAASLAGQHVLVVDKADSTRVSLAAFIKQLHGQVDAARSAAEAAGTSWGGDPVLGVFVLHNKQVTKAADLPDDILNGRYFYGEVSENVQISYPFNTQ